jgi:hypothetical protein
LLAATFTTHSLKPANFVCCQEHYHHVMLAYPFSSNHSVFLKKRITLLGDFVEHYHHRVIVV